MHQIFMHLTLWSPPPPFQKIALSGCTHLTVAFLFLAVLPCDLDVTLKARIIRSLIELDSHPGENCQILEKSSNILSFKRVHEVDVSECGKMNFGAAIKCLSIAFPSLKTLKASHCLHFTMGDLVYLIKKCSLIDEIDLTVDVSPVTPSLTVLSANDEGSHNSGGRSCNKLDNEPPPSNIGNYLFGKPVMANISKLTLEGRNDITGTSWFCLCFDFKPWSFSCGKKAKCFIFPAWSLIRFLSGHLALPCFFIIFSVPTILADLFNLSFNSHCQIPTCCLLPFSSILSLISTLRDALWWLTRAYPNLYAHAARYNHWFCHTHHLAEHLFSQFVLVTLFPMFILELVIITNTQTWWHLDSNSYI